jgi:drug/metabolite transporter (DMT)-like permease
MTGRLYLRAIVPIGLLYSASLVCSNMVYLYLSVAFIQMLKAAAPVAVLLTAWVWRVEEPSLSRLANILLIVAGVALASFGEIAFSLTGFLYQLGGTVFEAVRLIMIQVLLSGDSGAQKMDPLVSLYYYAPVCAVMNVLVAIPTELPRFDPADLSRAGYIFLLLNACVAFMLNVSSVFLVRF